MAVTSAPLGTTDRAVPGGVGTCAFSGPWHVRDAGLGDGCGRSGRRREPGSEQLSALRSLLVLAMLLTQQDSQATSWTWSRTRSNRWGG